MLRAIRRQIEELFRILNGAPRRCRQCGASTDDFVEVQLSEEALADGILLYECHLCGCVWSQEQHSYL